VVDANLSPILRRYVEQVRARYRRQLSACYSLQSNGGLVDAGRFRGKDAIPVRPGRRHQSAWRATTAEAGFAKVIGFDMGRHLDRRVALCRQRSSAPYETIVAGRAGAGGR